jgi:DNA-binding NtrC family response regulator
MMDAVADRPPSSPETATSVDPATLAGVLAEIAETASETLELQEVFGRVATSVRRLIPFDNMGGKALEQTRGNKSKAARLLGLTRAQLYSRIEKYGLA